ncbi:MAG: GIY-YIG nuclease family protein [Spirochaetes bacterium]|nr:GIY-YIG nuclease family protein [Spirochaetota bacterium]
MTDKNYYIYILETECGKFYCGITDNLRNRFRKHKSGKGAKFTRSFKPKKISAAWSADSRENALKIEIMIKKLNRNEKDKLVGNPDLLHVLLDIDENDFPADIVKIDENDFV